VNASGLLLPFMCGYSSFGILSDFIPKRKPRRLALIRDAWQHVRDYEDWIYPIHTLDHHQRLVRIISSRYRASYVATETKQGRLGSID